MLTNKIRTGIITAVAALSVVSLGPMTSVASARAKAKGVQVGKIQIDCPVEDQYGHITWYPEGTKRDREVEAADGTVVFVHEECANGEWISAQVTTLPKTIGHEGPSVTENS